MVTVIVAVSEAAGLTVSETKNGDHVSANGRPYIPGSTVRHLSSAGQKRH